MNNKGFTLIEAMICVAMVMIVASIIIPEIFSFMKDEKIAQKAGSLVKEFKQEATIDNKIIVTDPVQSDVECFEGKKIIHMNGDIYHIGKMDTWGDIKSIDCN